MSTDHSVSRHVRRRLNNLLDNKVRREFQSIGIYFQYMGSSGQSGQRNGELVLRAKAVETDELRDSGIMVLYCELGSRGEPYVFEDHLQALAVNCPARNIEPVGDCNKSGNQP